MSWEVSEYKARILVYIVCFRDYARHGEMTRHFKITSSALVRHLQDFYANELLVKEDDVYVVTKKGFEVIKSYFYDLKYYLTLVDLFLFENPCAAFDF